MTPRKVVTALVVPIVLGAALAAGATVFAVTVVVLAGLALLDLSGVLAAAVRRPVVPAAAVGGLGLPLVVALDPGRGWERVGTVVALLVVAAFALTLVTGRHRAATAIIGATIAAGLVIGTGAAGLLLVAGDVDGVGWAVGLLVLAGAVGLAEPLAAGLSGVADRDGTQALAPVDAPRPATPVHLAATVLAAAVAALVIGLVLSPPYDPVIAAVAAVLAVALGILSAELNRTLSAAAGIDPGGPGRWLLGRGGVVAAATPVLLLAPALTLLARPLTA